jgi:hypothetical protein
MEKEKNNITGRPKYPRSSEKAVSENYAFLPGFIALAISTYVKTRICYT